MAQASAVPVSGSKLDNRRVIAGLIDVAIVAVGAVVIMAAAGVSSASEAGAPLTAVTLGWALYYYFACESAAGQTLGKRVMKIRVVRADGAPAGMREIALRTVLRLIDGLFVYLVGLIAMIATGERRARLGDLVGQTKIVSADQPATVAPATVPAVPVSRVPIAESGPAFEPTPEVGPDAAAEGAVVEDAVDEAVVELESPSLQELAVDVAATAGSAPDDEDEQNSVVEELPAVKPADEPPPAAAEADEEPVVEVLEDEQPADEEPAADADDEDGEDDLDVKSVETISAIDLVMEDSKKDS